MVDTIFKPVERIRVLQVISHLGYGGAQGVVTHLACNLDPMQFEVRVLSLFRRSSSIFEQKLNSEGIEVWYLDKSLGFSPKIYPLIDCIFRDYEPKIVHSHLYTLRYILPSLVSYRIPAKVHTIHNLAKHDESFVGRLVNQMAFRLGVIPVAIAKQVASSIVNVYKIKDPPLIPNGIPLDYYWISKIHGDQLRQQEGIPLDAILFVNIGRMSPAKNQTLLIKAFAIISGIVPDCHLILVGDGELHETLRNQVKTLNLHTRVHFLRERDDVPEILSAADVFVLTSDWEGNPLSVMEAMAAGKPVICTAVGGVPELVQDDETGYLVPAGDVQKLVVAMSRLATDATNRARMGQCAIKIAKARFDDKKMVCSYENLYKSILAYRLTH